MLPWPPRRHAPLGPGKLSARQRVLAQWRGVELSSLQTARSLTAQPVATVMPKVLTDLRIDRRQSEAEVLKVWNTLLDPNITAHAQPTGLRNGTLFVAVDSNVWLSEIVRYRRKEILDRLQHSLAATSLRRSLFGWANQVQSPNLRFVPLAEGWIFQLIGKLAPKPEVGDALVGSPRFRTASAPADAVGGKPPPSRLHNHSKKGDLGHRLVVDHVEDLAARRSIQRPYDGAHHVVAMDHVQDTIASASIFAVPFRYSLNQ